VSAPLEVERAISTISTSLLLYRGWVVSVNPGRWGNAPPE
jgi:hypothetical protein